jgi:hypothetical protein
MMSQRQTVHSQDDIIILFALNEMSILSKSIQLLANLVTFIRVGQRFVVSTYRMFFLSTTLNNLETNLIILPLIPLTVCFTYLP